MGARRAAASWALAALLGPLAAAVRPGAGARVSDIGGACHVDNAALVPNSSWGLLAWEVVDAASTLLAIRQAIDGKAIVVSESSEPAGVPRSTSWWARERHDVVMDNRLARCPASTAREGRLYAAAHMDRLLGLAALARFSDEATCEATLGDLGGSCSYRFLQSCTRSGSPKVLVEVSSREPERFHNFSLVVHTWAGNCSGSERPACNHYATWRIVFFMWVQLMRWHPPHFAALVHAIYGFLVKFRLHGDGEIRSRVSLARAMLQQFRHADVPREVGAQADSWPLASAFDCPVTSSPTCAALRDHVRGQWGAPWMDSSWESAAAVAVAFDALADEAGDENAGTQGAMREHEWLAELGFT